MNDTLIPQEKLTNLKDLANRVENIKLNIKHINSLYFEQGFKFTEKQYKEIARSKRLKKEYQKRINEIIKKL